MIDDMAPLIEAMDQMDAEDPTVAQAGKDRAALILSEAGMSFAKLAELIRQRRLLLQPAILARIKRMDQPGMLGDAAFRDTGSALRKEGQSFLQIAEAIVASGKFAPRDRQQMSEPLHQITSEPSNQMPSGPGWSRSLKAITLLVGIALFPLRHPLRFLALVLLAAALFYGSRALSLGQQVSTLIDRIATVRRVADKLSSVSSSINEQALRQSKEAPTTPPVLVPSPSPAIPSPSAAATSPPSATPSAAPATAAAPPAPTPAPSTNEPAVPAPPAAPVPPAATPAPPSVAPASPPDSTSRRDARSAPPSRSASGCGAAREDRSSGSRRCAPVEDDRRPRTFEDDRRSRTFEDDRRPRTFENMVPEAIRRNSRMAGPCTGGVGGCYWGGGQH
jgi:hypothetical protein